MSLKRLGLLLAVLLLLYLMWGGYWLVQGLLLMK
jgi:hypothetical protein